MFASLAQAIVHNMMLAGIDFQWSEAKHSRPRTDAFPGLRQWLTEAQDGLCAACGETLSGEVEVCHVVAARDLAKHAKQGNDVDVTAARGYCAGNLYAGHRGCNVDDALLYGPIVPEQGFRRADLIALTYPSRADMLRAGARANAQAEADRKRRRAARIALGAMV